MVEHPVGRISGFVKINHYKNLVRIGNIMTSFIVKKRFRIVTPLVSNSLDN